MAGQSRRPYFSNNGTSTKAAIKAGEAHLFALEVSNPNTDDAFIQLFDAAIANVTVGSTTPTLSLLVPAGQSSTVRGAMDKDYPDGVFFGSGITYACTTTPTGSTNPTSALTINALTS